MTSNINFARFLELRKKMAAWRGVIEDEQELKEFIHLNLWS
jgi:glutaredoxin-related protein